MGSILQGYWGDTLTAASDFYLRAAEQESRRRRDEEAADLRSLQSRRLRNSIAAEEAMPANLQALAAGQPEAVEFAPAIPGQPPSIAPNAMGPMEVDEGPPPGAPALPAAPPMPAPGAAQDELPPPEESATPPTQIQTLQPTVSQVQVKPATEGQPAVTGSVHTLRSMMKSVGPQGMAQLMATPQGQDAIKAMAPVSDAEIERRRKSARGSQEAQVLRKEAEALILAGDMTQAYLKQAAALERMAEAEQDDARKNQLLVRAEGIRDKATELQKDPAERKLADADAALVFPAMAEYTRQPTADNAAKAMEAFQGVKSLTWRREGMQFLTRLTQGTKLRDADEDAFWSAVAADQADDTTKGGGKRLSESIQAVAKDQPDLYRKALPKLIKATNAEVLRGIGAEAMESNDVKLAYSRALLAVDEDGNRLEPGSEAFKEVFEDNLRGISEAKGAGARLRNQDTIEARSQDNADRIAGRKDVAGMPARSRGAGAGNPNAVTPEDRLRRDLTTDARSLDARITAIQLKLANLGYDASGARVQLERELNGDPAKGVLGLRETRRLIREKLGKLTGVPTTPSVEQKAAQRAERGAALFAQRAVELGVKKGTAGDFGGQRAAINAWVAERLRQEGL